MYQLNNQDGTRRMLSHHRAVVLTYHRIPAEIGKNSKFYDLPLDDFKAQMKIVAEQKQSTPEVCITFDDGTSDHLAVGDLLHDLGLSGTFFIITGRLGQRGYLTQDQVLHLARQGHRIASHTVSHPHLSKLSVAELDEELITSKQFLEDLTHQTVDWFAPPGGIYNGVVLDRALALGYSVFRTMEWGYVKASLKGRTPCIPILPSCNSDSFRRILDGKASLWPYAVKETLKKVVGDEKYHKIRSFLSTLNKQLQFRN